MPDVPRQISHYQVLSELRRESLGTVYRAYDLRRQREVSLKVMNQSVPDDEFDPMMFPPGIPDEDSGAPNELGGADNGILSGLPTFSEGTAPATARGAKSRTQ